MKIKGIFMLCSTCYATMQNLEPAFSKSVYLIGTHEVRPSWKLSISASISVSYRL